jgi:hypothetical protein
MRMKQSYRVLGMVVAVMVAFVLCGTPIASAQPSGGGKIVEDEQVKNLVKTIKKLITGLKTKGKDVRGASGAIAELLTSSDKVICAGWLVNAKKTREKLAGQIDKESDPQARAELLELYQKLRELSNRIERICDPILNPEAYTGTGQPGSATEPAGDPEDEIFKKCQKECADEDRAYDKAFRAWQDARDAAEDAEWKRKRLEHLDSLIEWAEANLKKAQEEDGDVTTWEDILGRFKKEKETADLDKAKKDEKKAKEEADKAKKAKEKALQAWLDCMSKCRKRLEAEKKKEEEKKKEGNGCSIIGSGFELGGSWFSLAMLGLGLVVIRRRLC